MRLILNFARIDPLNFRGIWIFLFFLSWYQMFKIRCIHEASSVKEAKIKQHTSSKKQLCEIGEEAKWESRFTSFFLYYLQFWTLYVHQINCLTRDGAIVQKRCFSNLSICSRRIPHKNKYMLKYGWKYILNIFYIYIIHICWYISLKGSVFYVHHFYTWLYTLHIYLDIHI